jgi:hypothetical protein
LKEIEKNKEEKEKELNEQINKYEKEKEILILEINNIKLKLEQKNNENINLDSVNKELTSKIINYEKNEKKTKEEYENSIAEKDETINKLETQINKINEDLINSVQSNNNNIKELNNIIKKLTEEKCDILFKLKDNLIEIEEISCEYQKNLNKLKNIKFLNNEFNNQEEEVFTHKEITEPKNINDFLIKCTDEIISLKNENFILKNNINDLDLKINLEKEQINDYKIENYNLKKSIGNYGTELDKNNKILNQIQIKNKDNEKLLYKANNDRKLLFNILMKIFKLIPNSNIESLLNAAFQVDLDEKMADKNENLLKKIFKEIQLFENYIIELKDNKTKFEDLKKKKRINNNIIINNNTNNIESINSINNIKNLVDKIYLKKLYKKDDYIKNDGKNKHK